MPAEAIATWMVAARRNVSRDVSRVLDLGSGTGRFSAALADTFDADVVAVEPSSGMRVQAAGKPNPRVQLVGGRAEHLPLASGSCDIAWLSNVVHHIDDLPGAARELRRVVDGDVLFRGAFGGRRYDFTLYRFFPEAESIVDSMSSVGDVIDAFERAGFASVLLESVSALTARSYAEAYEAATARADTALELISDDAFARGLELLARAARDESGPVVDRQDLLVLR